jgi:hypothetical protein
VAATSFVDIDAFEIVVLNQLDIARQATSTRLARSAGDMR